ncbi:hypothetical protein BRCON_2867 [Candidatus Sumerlaea chitinivorans]|uniref:Uncharacterized protein n=1 Tax=Sumerlaea chitinivorans TaxID=2250252 RepID=A0A2Z4Y9L7_SUMC1|nr:hypothetical protein BRCON_2867 [Candidatus Sumerlaea chitinivorans]
MSFFCFFPLDRDKAEFVLSPSSRAGAEDLQAEAEEEAPGFSASTSSMPSSATGQELRSGTFTYGGALPPVSRDSP